MKSHFQFSNQQRNGIFLLILLIISLQCFYYFSDSEVGEIEIDNQQLDQFRNEVDSLRQIEISNKQPKIFPFNPNFITDYKGYTLGMSNEEIDRLLQFRAKNQWVNSAKHFQQITQVSDSLLNTMAPYFKFPDWVTKAISNSSSSNLPSPKLKHPKTYNQKQDLNRATAMQLQKVYGVGEKLSQRIISFRNSLHGGFAADIELAEVYGLSEEVIAQIMKDFTVKTPRKIPRINLNEATIDDLVQIRYIDYEIAHNIVEERILRDGFNSLEELTKVEDFPVHKIEIIKLYLQL
jgi:DNA uptake protein ComE-like DNA-binding protein